MKNCNKQNEKIELVTDKTLVIGVDIGQKDEHARAFDNRKRELSKKPLHFTNDINGFETFKNWTVKIMRDNGMKYVIVGMEPTSIYWVNFATYCNDNGMVIVHVNPAAVHKSKELDDNDPSKNDRKDPKVIAGLIPDGRYSFPYMPEGDYAALRKLSNLRHETNDRLTQCKNRLAKWISLYFPELNEVFKGRLPKTMMYVLKNHPLPSDVETLGVEGILAIWKQHKVRGVGKQKAKELYEAAKRSVGRTEESAEARLDFKYLEEDIRRCQERMDELDKQVEEVFSRIENVDKLLEIPGVGKVTVMTFLAEVGDISRFKDPKEIQKLAGLAIVTNESCKHKGDTRISYRGRKRLRWALYEVAMTLIAKNQEFKDIHEYYVTREQNPLKGLQSVIAVACKVIRIFFKILKTGVRYDGQKMALDITRPQYA